MKGMGRRTEQPKMLTETPAQLVAHLSDANGWWRDTAQQLLILKQDKSVVPALQKLARSPGDQLGTHSRAVDARRSRRRPMRRWSGS